MKGHSAGRGGVVISDATVITGGGDIIGRDKVDSLSRPQLEELFAAVSKTIGSADPANSAEAMAKLQILKDETAKGRDANDSLVAKLVEGLVDLVPAAASGVVSMFASPILAAFTGPVTKYVVEKIHLK
ncbi:hypothetical protein GCM10007874_02950 [Labrys miyagiensis]|uniref:Uncharacterized protein n=1 Tax=Labrys miyagiensis TaxID=346912 RepID=A0ABQ6CBF3_9HYPH|nr:hypothetical protein [Labrys miyagiensis]GLS17280.1 hypothetical protein GCM10007874_02950 [Labrys miyagiensis]